MGILHGSLTYLQFRVEGGVPSNYIEVFERALEIRRFVPLHADGEDEQSFGWVPLQRPYADDEPILNDHFLFGECVVLGYREDTMAYPKAMMRDLVQRKMDDYRDEHHVEPSAHAKRAIEATVMSELRKRILPKSKIVDALWDLSRNEVRFFARGKTVSERFTSLFEQTFEVRLRQMTFGELAMSSDLSLRAKGVLETLTPQTIFNAKVRTEVN